MTTCSEQFIKLVKVTLSETQQIQDQTNGDENIQDMNESAKSQDVFHDTTTRIKSKNVLSNIDHVLLTRKTTTMKILFFMFTC